MISDFLMALVIFAAETTAEVSTTGVPWGVLSAAGGIVATAITILWRTSESRVNKLLDLQERSLTAIAANTAALEALRDALAKD